MNKPKQYSAEERAKAWKEGKVMIDLPPLGSLNVAQMREFCRQKGIKRHSELNRQQLVELITRAINPDGSVKKEYTEAKKRKTVGVPSYETHVEPQLDRILVWRADGLTIEDIAGLLGITKRVLHNYANRHPELAKVLDHSKVKLLTDLEHSLYQRALGLTNITEEELTEERIYNKITKQYEWVVTKKRVKITTGRASDGLLIFALKNLTRGDGKWLDARLVEALALAGKSNEELEELTKALNTLGYLNKDFESNFEIDMKDKERVCTDED